MHSSANLLSYKILKTFSKLRCVKIKISPANTVYCPPFAITNWTDKICGRDSCVNSFG